MKNKIFKIIIMLTVSLFLSVGVSMAHDKVGKRPKSNGKAYGCHKKHKGHDHYPCWNEKHYKSYRHKHGSHGHYHRHYYHKSHWHHHKWHKKHYKSHHHRHKHHYHKRYGDDDIHEHPRHYKHRKQEDEFFFEISFHDPYMAVVIGANGR